MILRGLNDQGLLTNPPAYRYALTIAVDMMTDDYTAFGLISIAVLPTMMPMVAWMVGPGIPAVILSMVEYLQHRLHFDCDVAIIITALGDMADAGPGEVIRDDRNPLGRHHVEHTQP
jgi:hypothetical protein